MKPKDMALSIMSKRKKKDEEDEHESDDESGDDYELAAGNILDAVESGDRESFASSLRDFVGMCKG